ncbi:hypothetical protein AGDE_09970 [Angomonas deanei]|uniref:Kinesin motor domain-containing protein n=1 Tax=Angomonas deanei TaxID=59799 RepID=A0A7G2CPH6_9TRYP|nr:hypothetical protein AGDE_09970 [Angomonas deanei]CAD2221405.1 hypothetical protein, conserved [Angomonas deanei]|eukprot:EPY29409.1 hypothetical protein AGDE_09970 [Angomonas deanei]
MGSMYGNQMGNGSMYGFSNNGSQMNMGSMYSQGGMGSLYGLGGMGSMYRPVGSMYGMGGAGQTSAYNFAAQWGSLANMSQQTGEMSEDGRRSSISGKGGFGKNSKITTEDLCPNIGTFEDGRPIKRSGKRGGNRLYSKDKNDTTAPVVTSSSQASAMTIKRKTSGSSFQSAATRSTGTTATTKDGKTRAKVPANFDVHTLLVVGQDKGSYVTVRDPNAVVFQSGGKKETFECDEALEQTSDSEDVDSVLLSGLRGNWFGGHNSSLLVAAGKGKTEASYNLARGFIDTCLQRLETNEKDASTVFDITITMCAIKNGDTGKDLLGSGDYKKLKLASSPIYGPCLNDLTTKTTKKSAETLKVFNGGLSAAKDKKDIICAFLVLKQIKKVGSGTEVHLSSLCVALFQEEVANLVSLKDKSSSSPHKLFRYALGGPSVCCSALCVSNSDEKARDGLEAERKVREVKNREPRSGNVKKFIGYTEKEIARQKEKLSSASDSEKKSIEKRVASMESMVKDAQEMQDNPEKTAPKGYAM